jgi:predicted site-specific integrase-resolvase
MTWHSTYTHNIIHELLAVAAIVYVGQNHRDNLLLMRNIHQELVVDILSLLQSQTGALDGKRNHFHMIY